MPSIVCRARIREVSDHCTLSLGVRHHLVAGSSSDSAYGSNKTRFPDDVDVLVSSNVVITLSGVSDGASVSAEEFCASELSQHLVDCFQTNASKLGLNTISKLRIDEEDGFPKVVLTPSRQLPANAEILPIHALLIAIDLSYSWQTSGSSTTKPDRTSHPFAPRMSLPHKTLLSNVLGRFMTWQLVKRYPLIFGPWCQQLDVESSHFPGIAGSILRIMKRSPNAAFRSKCRPLIKALRVRHLSALTDASTSLSGYLSSMREDSFTPFENNHTDITDEDILCFGLDRIYRDGLSRPIFKGQNQAHAPSTDRADDELLSREHDLPAGEPITPIHEDLLWDDILLKDNMVNLNFDSCFLDVTSDGDCGFPIDDTELDSYAEIEEDEGIMGPGEDVHEHWSNDEMFPLEQFRDDPEGDYDDLRLGHGTDHTDSEVSLCDDTRSPRVLDLEDDFDDDYLENDYDAGLIDSFTPPPSGRSELLLERATGSTSKAFQLEPYTGHASTTSDDDRILHSQAVTRQILGSSEAAKIACWPLISRRPQLNSDGADVPDAPQYENELELDLSDTDSIISAPEKTRFNEGPDLVRNGDVSVAGGTRPSFPVASSLHRSPTLDVTWLPRSGQPMEEEEFADSDDEYLWCGECVEKSIGVKLGEDEMFLMDFGLDTA